MYNLFKNIIYWALSFIILLFTVNSGIAQTNNENIIIVLDLSKSMNETLNNGEKKVDVAKKAVRQVLATVPDSVRVGLRVYGQKSGFLGLNQCTQSTLISPIKENNKEDILKNIEKLDPNGVTPIEYSLRKAVEDFDNLQGPKKIILISDGLETCNGDPCKFAKDLSFEYPDIKVDVISFVKNIGNFSLDSQLKCISLATNGKFSKTDTEIDLVNAIKNSFMVDKKLYWQIMPNY